MAKQTAGRPLPPLPPSPLNPEGVPAHNPSGGPPAPPVTVDGHPVSPAVARSRGSAAAGQGHGGSGK